MGKAYRCPNCNGTEIIWDRGLRKVVCPKDKTPIDNYKTEDDAGKCLGRARSSDLMSKEITEAETRKAFHDVLFDSSKPTVCDSCSYVILTRRGYRSPCKKGHYDSGKDKESCEDHPNPECHSKKS